MASLGATLAVATSLLTVGCSSDVGNPSDVADRPGSKVIAGIIACKTDADCHSGEACGGEGYCQMKRCGGTYASRPPLGTNGYAFLDRAFVAAGDEAVLRILSPYATGAASRVAVGQPPLDVAGGNFTGEKREGIAAIVDNGVSTIVALASGGTVDLPVGFPAKRVAAGDVTGDGIDEVLVLGDTKYAVCDVLEATCTEHPLRGDAVDLAVGDVNADGIGELLLLGKNTLVVVEATTGKMASSQPMQKELVSLAAGDLDGDGKAEIFGVERGGTFSEDTLHVYQLGQNLVSMGELALGYTVSNTALDVAFTKQDDKPRIGVLATTTKLIVAEIAGGAVMKVSEAATSGAKRLASADVVGRSVAVRLKDSTPHLEIGPPVPIAVLTLPPYSATYSQGPSSATLGTTDESSTSETSGSSKTVSLSLGGGIGTPTHNPISGALSAVGLPASFSLFLSRTWSQTASRTVSKNITLSVGNSYTVTAEPQIDGYNSGAVVIAGGCYHRFDYAVEDADDILAIGTDTLQTFVPVGGETSLWSTRRYNALVDAIGDGRLPKVNIPMKLGTVSSYPAEPTTLEGTPIASEDLVFPDPLVTRSSDIGSVAFNMTVNESTTNTDATAFNYSKSHTISGNIGVISGQVTQDVNWGLDQSYSVTLGTSATFSGQIGPVRDDPSTPANEATVHGYSFNPVVYRQHFTSGEDKEGAYYVMTYTAGQ